MFARRGNLQYTIEWALQAARFVRCRGAFE
uniref:Uncharacterized protein n=1 Tax=Arundo donax TaxID=35708 RepID=A0A0A9G6J0_ARUDO